MQAIKKPTPHGVHVGWTITLVSLMVFIFALAAVIIVSRSVGDNEGNQIVLVTLLLSFALCGLIAGPIITVTKRREAKDIDEIHAGQNVLAHWTYAPAEWSYYIEQELTRAHKYFLSIFVFITFVLLALILPALPKSSLRGSSSTVSGLTILITIGLVGILLWVGLYAPILAARKRGQGDVYISPRGVLLNDRYYSWMVLYASGSPNVSYKAGKAGYPSILQFKWTISAGTNRNFKEVRVPVPRAHEQEVQHLLTYFKG
jgi:hypothetical protein